MANGKNGAEYLRVAAGYLEIRQKLNPKGHVTERGNVVVATTGGFKDAGDGVRVSLNAITAKTGK